MPCTTKSNVVIVQDFWEDSRETYLHAQEVISVCWNINLIDCLQGTKCKRDVTKENDRLHTSVENDLSTACPSCLAFSSASLVTSSNSNPKSKQSSANSSSAVSSMIRFLISFDHTQRTVGFAKQLEKLVAIET